MQQCQTKSFATSWPDDPEKEIAARTLARRNLIDFTVYTFPGYIVDPFHELLAGTLESVLRGGIKRLMVFSPPQHGKTELVSVRFPAFWLAHRPDSPIILTSYAANLAHVKSRESRAVVESSAYRSLFPEIQTDKTSRAVEHWRLQGHRGSMRAAGVGGGITGHGGLLGIIDDPFEGWAQAQSSTVREKTFAWWRGTFRPRIWEDGVIVLIMTRWHEFDLAGRLLDEQGDRWLVLRLPALAETQADRDENNRLLGLPKGEADPLGRESGEPLSPRRFSGIALEEIRADVGSLVWNAEYQGVPRPPEGQRFKRSWFPVVQQAPAVVARKARYWDFAATSGAGAYSVGTLMSWVRPGIFYIEDVVRGQWSSLERDKIVKQTAIMDAEASGNTVQVWFEEEGGSSGKDASAATIRLLVGFPVHAHRVTGSKEVRAEPFAAQCEATNVFLVKGRWNAGWLDEVTSFPFGANKDQVDSSSGAFAILVDGKLWKKRRGISSPFVTAARKRTGNA